MNNYTVSPDDCTILAAVNQSSSVREAARFLSCDPSGLLRKIHRISQDYDFLRKVEGKWELTNSGLQLVSWYKQSIISQNEALKLKSNLRIGSFSWLTNQVLLPDFDVLKTSLKNTNQISLLSFDDYEKALKSLQTDFVIACHPPEDPDIAHKKIVSEKWTIIIPFKWQKLIRNKTEKEIFDLLAQKPFVKHKDMNPSEHISSIDFSHNIDFELDNLDSIKTAVQEGIGWSFVPKLLIQNSLKEKSLIDIPIKNSLTNHLSLWKLRSRKDLEESQKIIQRWLTSILT